MASLADVVAGDTAVDDMTAFARPPEPREAEETGPGPETPAHQEEEPQPQPQPLSRVRPLVIRQVSTATKGKGRIKPRRAQLGAGHTEMASVPRIDGACPRTGDTRARTIDLRQAQVNV
jgi:hypothetical protein